MINSQLVKRYRLKLRSSVLSFEFGNCLLESYIKVYASPSLNQLRAELAMYSFVMIYILIILDDKTRMSLSNLSMPRFAPKWITGIIKGLVPYNGEGCEYLLYDLDWDNVLSQFKDQIDVSLKTGYVNSNLLSKIFHSKQSFDAFHHDCLVRIDILIKASHIERLGIACREFRHMCESDPSGSGEEINFSTMLRDGNPGLQGVKRFHRINSVSNDYEKYIAYAGDNEVPVQSKVLFSLLIEDVYLLINGKELVLDVPSPTSQIQMYFNESDVNMLYTYFSHVYGVEGSNPRKQSRQVVNNIKTSNSKSKGFGLNREFSSNSVNVEVVNGVKFYVVTLEQLQHLMDRQNK